MQTDASEHRFPTAGSGKTRASWASLIVQSLVRLLVGTIWFLLFCLSVMRETLGCSEHRNTAKKNYRTQHHWRKSQRNTVTAIYSFSLIILASARNNIL